MIYVRTLWRNLICHAYFILVLVLNRTTHCTKQHRQLDNCLIEFSFNLGGTFIPRKTCETLLHFNHTTWIRLFTLASVSPLFCTLDPKYLNRVTWVHLLMVLHSMHHALLPLRHTPSDHIYKQNNTF